MSGSTVSDVATILPASNRLTEIRDGAGVLSKSYALRTGGDLASQAITGGPTYDYVYSPRGRLASVKQGGVEVASYLYDYAGHRVVRTIPATPQTIHYIYGPDGHVIAEHDGATGAPLREYVWLDDMPLALVTGSAPAPQYSFIHTGQLDEPLLVTDMSQSRQWNVVSDPWGNALPLSTPTIAQDLRLPGQYSQVESGLFQNWHRDFDPTLGRYIEADPIGLAGGSNLFLYANGNPTKYTDPTGEVPALVVIAIGGAIEGVIIDYLIQKYWEKRVCLDYGRLASSGAIGAVTGVIGGVAAPHVGRLLQGVGGKLGAKAPLTKAEQLAVNKAAGDAFEDAIAADLAQSGSLVGRQITIKTKSGLRTRVDFMTKDPFTSRLGCIDCKASQTARVRPNQAAAFDEIGETGGTIVGAGKPGFPGGTSVPPTGVEIIRGR